MVEADPVMDEPDLARGASAARGSQVSGADDGWGENDDNDADGWDDDEEYDEEAALKAAADQPINIIKTASSIQAIEKGYRVLPVKSFEKRIFQKIEDLLEIFAMDDVDPLIIIARHYGWNQDKM